MARFVEGFDRISAETARRAGNETCLVLKYFLSN